MLTLIPEPGKYESPQSVTVYGPEGVTGVLVTLDGNDPVLVRTVCSTNKIPGKEYPYVQTIEDGRGRAVLDGSFPKYYNNTWEYTTPPSSFNDLIQNHKFLYNAFNFLRGSGNKVLILGDKTGVDNYVVTDASGSMGFKKTFDGIATLMGLDVTYKIASDYTGGKLDPTYEECILYDVIFLMSSDSGVQGLTMAGAVNIAQARRNGVGVYVCTDNGGSADGVDTRYPEGFYATANVLVTTMTSGNFQGRFDFSPGTTVQYNETKWGPSPLFDGLQPTDIMGASTSDSYVNQAVTSPQALPVNLEIPEGYTVVKFAVLHTDGSVTFEQYGYSIGQPDLIETCDSEGNTLTWPQTNLKTREVYFKYIPGTMGPATGFVTVNGQTCASFSEASEGLLNLTWLDSDYSSAAEPNRIHMHTGESLSVSVDLSLPIPFSYGFPFNRFQLTTPPQLVAQFIYMINRNEFATDPISAAAVLNKAINTLGYAPPDIEMSDVIYKIYDEMR